MIQAYTDGSKNEQGVGSGVVIFARKELAAQMKLKLDSRCSNNQAEQLATVRALEAIEFLAILEYSPVKQPYTPTARPAKERWKSHLPYQRDQEEYIHLGEFEVDDTIFVGQGPHRNVRKRIS
jgi:hypothetical protein